MKILSLETSGAVASAAVSDGDMLIGEYSINNKTTHSQKLLPMVSGLLNNLSLEPSDIDVFAAAIGPGSFTGLRIGIATIKGMAHALGKDVVGVPSLEGLAYNLAGTSGLICPIMDARNDTVYAALYSFDNNNIKIVKDNQAILVSELIEMLSTMEPITFLGDGVLKYKDSIQNKLGSNAIFAPGHLLLQKASSVGFAAYSRYVSGQKDSYISIKPIYLRPSQAERMFCGNNSM